MFLVDETNSFFIEFVYSCYTNEIVPSSHLDRNISLELSQGGWAFALIFVWEVVPEYMMPILTGVNLFCLAKRNSSE
jgi:hypothetical protein